MAVIPRASLDALADRRQPAEAPLGLTGAPGSPPAVSQGLN